tara:strand:+ start:672 stop:1646 length:975 start_codon:yes stop_codon:yes gene_type:complete
METKICRKCGVEKSIIDFRKSGCRTLADGSIKQHYKRECKQCQRKGRTRVDNVDPKVCSKCGISKPLSEYHFDKNIGKDGRYRADCKCCRNSQRREHYPKVKDKINAKSRDRWANEPGYAERQKDTAAKSRKKHGWKYKERRKKLYWENPEKYLERARQFTANMTDEQRKKRAAKNKEYREINKEELKIKQIAYVEKNKEKIKERQRKFYQDNPEHIKKLRRIQYEKHQEKLVEEQRKIRRERRAHLIERLGGKCLHCGTTRNLQFDHIIPADKTFTIAAGLTKSLVELYEEVDKCQLLCGKCHLEKTKEDWLSGAIEIKRKNK